MASPAARKQAPVRAGTTVLTLARFKGGSATTATTVGLAAALAGIDAPRGSRVLVIDTDQQGNLSSRLGTDLGEDDPRDLPGVGEVLTGQLTAADAIVGTRWDRLDLLPAGDLHGIDTHLARQPVGQVALRNALAGIVASGTYDWVLIDTPPSQGEVVQAALVAADLIAAPTPVTSLDALNGVADLVALIGALGDAGLPVGVFAGIIATRHKNTVKAHAAFDAAARHYTVLGSVGERALWSDAEALRVPPQAIAKTGSKQRTDLDSEFTHIIRKLNIASKKAGK
jgi:chromosome partitioning protein